MTNLTAVEAAREERGAILNNGHSIRVPANTDSRSNQAFSIVFHMATSIRHVEGLLGYDSNNP